MLTQRIVAGSFTTGQIQASSGPGSAETMLVTIIKEGGVCTVAEIDKVALYRFAATVMSYLGKDIPSSIMESALVAKGDVEGDGGKSGKVKPPVGFNGGAASPSDMPSEPSESTEPPTTTPEPPAAPEGPAKPTKTESKARRPRR